MEDQQADTSDLTTESDASPTPQGKATRSKHRLPRAALRQATNTGDAAEAAASEPVAEETAGATDSVESADVESADVESVGEPVAEETAADETAVEETAAEETATEEPATATEATPKPRIRFSRGRRTTTDEPAADEPAADATDDAVDAEALTPDADAPAPVLVPHRTAGRPLKVALIVAAALFVGAAAFTGATLQPYLTDRAVVHTKFQVAETAARAITTLWTYTPDDMANLPARSAKYLGGDFANEYSKYIEAIVAPNKQAQITNNTQVLGAAVESLKGDEATAIVYTNSVATSPVTKGAPSLRYLSYRLAMKRQGSDWLITRMTALTSLDVTPRI